MQTLLNPSMRCLFIFLFACSSASTDHLLGGSRLRVITLSGSGVARDYAFYDTKLATPCVFTVLHDGEAACTPAGSAVTQVGARVFADAGCTQIATLVTTRCGQPLPTYATDTNGSDDCSPPVRVVYRVTPSTATTVYVGPSCTPTPVPAGQSVGVLGAPLAVSDFVTAAASTHTLDGRFAIVGWKGSDGSLQPYRESASLPELNDTHLDTPCHFGETADRVIRCLPDGALDSGQVFADSQCAVPAVPVACGAPQYVDTQSADSTDVCRPIETMYAVGPTTDTAYDTVSSACAVAPAGSASVVARGAPIADSTFAAFKSVIASSGRVRMQRLQDGAGADLFSNFIDSTTGLPCFLYADGDTSHFRCLPNSSFVLRYADASCTQAIAVQALACGPSGKIAVDYSNACAPAVFAVGAPVTTPIPTYVRATDGTCGLFGIATGSTFTAIPEPTSDFPALTLSRPF